MVTKVTHYDDNKNQFYDHKFLYYEKKFGKHRQITQGVDCSCYRGVIFYTCYYRNSCCNIIGAGRHLPAYRFYRHLSFI